MKNSKSFLKKYGIYILSFILPIIILLIIYYLKDVYPFGTQTVSNTDLPNAYVPAYYNLWDIVYNKASLFYNFNVGAGTSIYDFTSIYGLLNPIDWIVLLTSRDNIPNMINFIVLIKIALISLSATILFKRLYKKLSNFYTIIFSLLYAFSGYVIFYHTNMPWLTIMALFPILLLGLKKLFDKNKPLLYIITLTLTLISSVYMSYMVILFIILFSFAYIYVYIPKEKKRKIVYTLGISTVLSIGISSIFVFPTVYLIVNSSRFSSNNFPKIALSNLIFDTENKLAIMCVYGLPYILLYKFFRSDKIKKEDKKFYFIILFLTMIPILLEHVNCIWHTGQYKSFPYRYGFIPTLFILMAGIKYLYVHKEIDIKLIKSKIYNIFCIFGSTFGVVLLAISYYYFYFLITKLHKLPALKLEIKYGLFLLFIFAISVIIIYFIIKINIKKTIKRIIITSIIGLQLFSNCYINIGINRENLENEFRDSYLLLSNELYEYTKNDNTYYKYKDVDKELLTNFPFILDTPSLSTWHLTNVDQLIIHNTLGYHSNGLKLYSDGGSIFSDQIFGVNRFITREKLEDNETYKLIGNTRNFYIYEYKNSLPIGIIYNTDNKILEMDYNASRLDNNNLIYQKLFNRNDNIIEENSYTEDTLNGKKIFKSEIQEKSYVYADYDGSDGKAFPYNYDYISPFTSVGIKENESAIIEYINTNKYESHFYTISYDKIWDLINNYEQGKVDIKYDSHSINIKTNVGKNKSIFLPFTYVDGMYAYNNGKEIKIDKVFGNYISIDLEQGENNIDIKFTPPLLKISAIISVISIILLVIYIKYFNKLYIDKFSIILYYLYYILVLGLFLYVYVFGTIINVMRFIK